MERVEGWRSLLPGIRRQTWVLVVVWTACVAGSLAWNLHERQGRLIEIARSSAEVTFRNDVQYRRWMAAQGGVYVPATARTPPNPYLEVANRDVLASSGVALTLMNPAYVARQVNEMDGGIGGGLGHLTSLRPLRPENRPDAWEEEALRSFEAGEPEAQGVVEKNGVESFRFMRPFVTEAACLKCHAAQGYREGDVRGGISVSVPVAPLRAIDESHESRLVYAHAGLWLLGLGGIGLTRRGIRRQILARQRAESVLRSSEDDLRQANERLETRVRERTAELARTIDSLRAEVESRERAEELLKSVNQELTVRADQLRKLAAELTLVEQRERRRMAQVLHDHLQQLLVGARFHTSVLGRLEDEAARSGAAEIDLLLREAIEASRSLTAELSPPILHEGGLVAGLEWLGRWMGDKHGVTVTVESGTDVPEVAADVKILVFESVRELLFNAVKHAGVRSVSVDVRPVPGRRLQVTVSDEGRGFDTARLDGAFMDGGFGLFSVRERLKLVGGSLEIESRPGEGSRFTVTVPTEGVDREGAAEGPDATPALSGAVPAGAPRPTGARIRVLLADDHAVLREGLRGLLAHEPEIEVVGEAKNGREAVELAASLAPDVILMDVGMPILNGIEATRRIHAELPQIRIIGLSMFEEAERARAMYDAGAVSYISKSGPAASLVAAILGDV